MIAARRLFYLLWVWLAVGVVAAFWPTLVSVWAGIGALLLLVALIDLFKVSRRPDISVVRTVSGSLALGVWSEVRLRLQQAAGSPVVLEIFDQAAVSTFN